MPAHFLRLDAHPAGLDGAALDDVAQFADVAGPRVEREPGQGFLSKHEIGEAVFGAELAEEVRGEFGEILGMLSLIHI